jgi:dihydropyrimidinase
MYPRKGAVAVGADADLVVWDPRRETVVSHAALHDAMDYTPFEGMTVTGWPACTISRGEIVWDGQSVRGEAGRGRFVARAPLGA